MAQNLNSEKVLQKRRADVRGGLADVAISLFTQHYIFLLTEYLYYYKIKAHVSVQKDMML